MFASPDKVYSVSISWNFILLSVTYNFGLGNWAKIERNDGNTPESYGLLLYLLLKLLGMSACPAVFPFLGTLYVEGDFKMSVNCDSNENIREAIITITFPRKQPKNEVWYK